jgi:hypothetical protein
VTIELHRELGEHDAKIENLEKEVHLLRKDVAEVYAKLDQINQTLATAKGGWRTLMLIGGAAGTMFAIAQTVFEWVLRR